LELNNLSKPHQNPPKSSRDTIFEFLQSPPFLNSQTDPKALFASLEGKGGEGFGKKE